jgi:hypothetical protein
MTGKTRRISNMFRAGQQGSAMILVLIFMALAGLIVPPMLAYMSTGLKAGVIYEEDTKKLYAAESGVNDGLWYVRYSDFSNLFGEAYDSYDFLSTWTYTVNETLNNQPVDVSVQNIWMPQNIPVPSEPLARSIAGTGKLLITSTANSTTTYKIDTAFYPDAGDNLTVETLGVWLPPGYNYVPGTSNLEAGDPGDPYYPSSVQVIPWASGEAIIWHFWDVPFEEFGPDVDVAHVPILSTVYFNYTAVKPDTLPSGIAWITTSGVDSIPFTWDANFKVYRIESNVGGEGVSIYATRSETRQLGAAVKGDYCAIGNVLETATGNVNYRDRLLKESSATVNNNKIPGLATIRDAWLYWSGWVDEGHQVTIWSDDCSALSSWNTIWNDDCSSLSSSQTIWQDSCSSFNNWDNGGAWSISSGRFRGHYSSGGDSARYLTMSSSVNLQPYAGQTVTIAWDQSSGGTLYSSDGLRFSVYNGSSWSGWMDAFHGNISSSTFTYTIPAGYVGSGFKIRFYLDGTSGYNDYVYIDNINISAASGGWVPGSDWDVASGQFRGHHSSGHSDSDRYLTMASTVDLSAYAGQTVRLSWSQSEGGTLESTDVLRFSIFDGSNWSSPMEAFHDDDPSSPFTYNLPGSYLTAGFKIRFYLDGFNDSDYSGTEYAYIDNIDLSVAVSGTWITGADWDVSSGRFRGHHGSSNSEEDRYLTQGSPVDLSPYQGSLVAISWDQSEGSGSLGQADGLMFAISKDGGNTWSTLIEAFHDDNPASPFSYTIPNNYLTPGFKIRFYLDQMSGTNQYAYIDNIKITQNDLGVNRVMFNGQEITADEQQAKEDTWQGHPTGTYSYSCSYDATGLVNQMIAAGGLGTNGAGTYTVGHILEPRAGDPGYSFTLYPSGTTGYPLAIPSSTPGLNDTEKQYSYAAWSLILIYTSPETLGHQLYLYDDFNFVENNSLDLPVSGFLAPNDPSGSKATFFVGEGDAGYTGDGVNFNGHPLSDAINPANNVWNSYSNALDNPYINGMDLDTFDISDYINPGDTSADIELYSNMEIYNSIYVILSFRSDSEFGGVISFLIGN